MVKKVALKNYKQNFFFLENWQQMTLGHRSKDSLAQGEFVD